MKKILIALTIIVSIITISNTASASACTVCHTIKKGARNKIGPNLFGIVGRVAGTKKGFHYSKALMSLSKTGMKWTEALIAEWANNPNKFLKMHKIHGRTKMTFMTSKAMAKKEAKMLAMQH